MRSSQPRRFTHNRFILLLLIILNFDLEPESSLIYQEYFENDLSFCPRCFHHQTRDCYSYFQTLKSANEVAGITEIFIRLFIRDNKRVTKQLQLPHSTNATIISKYYGKHEQLDSIKYELNVIKLEQLFRDEMRLDGLQFCPAVGVKKFVNFLHSQTNIRLYDEVAIWLHLLNNIQPILIPYLETQEFPVPKTYAVCGFTMFQEYGGRSLIYFYDADFLVKLPIAKQLLEAALKFSYGFESFRLYITDLNADNVIYNDAINKLYLIDLDTLFIVDGAATELSNTTHKHEYIECEGCFAYSPQDICAHTLSDINLFAACQFLREDLYKNPSKGFLSSLPAEVRETFKNLTATLDVCVDCLEPKCKNRFKAALDLIEIFENILNYYFINV